MRHQALAPFFLQIESRQLVRVSFIASFLHPGGLLPTAKDAGQPDATASTGVIQAQITASLETLTYAFLTLLVAALPVGPSMLLISDCH